MTRDEFLAFAEIARHECEDYYILGLDELYVDGKLKDVLDREIIDVSLIGDGLDRYHALLKSQQGKPYYVPSKAELLAYDDAFYCEPTEETNQMREFIETRLQLPEWKKSEVFDELVFGIRCADADFPQVQERLTAMGVHFPRRKDFQTFIERYQAFHNTTRMQSNRGYTPNELFDLLPREEQMPQTLSFGPNIKKALAEGSMNAEELRRGIMEADLPNEQLRLSLLQELAKAAPAKPVGEKKPKIGRNDPCPCGSGKKYKKCCGRLIIGFFKAGAVLRWIWRHEEKPSTLEVLGFCHTMMRRGFELKIVSWNLNGLSSCIQNNSFAPIADIGPDILCLQEIRTQQEPQILPGYQHCWNHGQRNGYAGTAVLYKKEPLSVSFGLGDDDADEEGRTIILE